MKILNSGAHIGECQQCDDLVSQYREKLGFYFGTWETHYEAS